jgi:hypothetical protein
MDNKGLYLLASAGANIFGEIATRMSKSYGINFTLTFLER